MPQDQVTLYSYVTSPFAMKVHAYLLFKQIPFQTLYVNPIKRKEILPIGRAIPVLKIGDEAKADSHEIGLWLDQLYPDRPLHTSSPDVIKADLELNQTLIPMMIYSVYPQFDGNFLRNLKNTLRLGFCINQTTEGGLPLGLRFLWPFFIRYTGFIQAIIQDVKSIYPNADECRQAIITEFDQKLAHNDFLAGTEHPTMADISAWPLLVIPDQLGLTGFDDYKSYPNIMRWIDEVRPMLEGSEQCPWFVPKQID